MSFTSVQNDVLQDKSLLDLFLVRFIPTLKCTSNEEVVFCPLPVHVVTQCMLLFSPMVTMWNSNFTKSR